MEPFYLRIHAFRTVNDSTTKAPSAIPQGYNLPGRYSNHWGVKFDGDTAFPTFSASVFLGISLTSRRSLYQVQLSFCDGSGY